MIFVTLGTQDFQFNRLLKEIDRLIDRQLIKEKVFAQIGHSSYTPEHYEFVHFIGEKEFDAMINDCSYVISHGGIGSIVMAIKKQKKVIAIPRLKKFREHVDDHQLEIVSLFGKEGYIKGIADTTMLEQSIVDLAAFIPQPFKSGNAYIVQLIQSYITENFK